MSNLDKPLPEPAQQIADSKMRWNASLPYPAWPFGEVDPKELAKWGRKHEKKHATPDNVEEALW